MILIYDQTLCVQVWSKLISNPAAKAPEHTLALLQVLLQVSKGGHGVYSAPHCLGTSFAQCSFAITCLPCQDGLLDSILPYLVSSLGLEKTLTPSKPKGK